MPWSESQRLRKDHDLLNTTAAISATDHSTGGGSGVVRTNGHIDPVVDEEVYDDRLFYSLLLKVYIYHLPTYQITVIHPMCLLNCIYRCSSLKRVPAARLLVHISMHSASLRK